MVKLEEQGMSVQCFIHNTYGSNIVVTPLTVENGSISGSTPVNITINNNDSSYLSYGIYKNGQISVSFNGDCKFDFKVYIRNIQSNNTQLTLSDYITTSTTTSNGNTILNIKFNEIVPVNDRGENNMLLDITINKKTNNVSNNIHFYYTFDKNIITASEFSDSKLYYIIATNTPSTYINNSVLINDVIYSYDCCDKSVLFGAEKRPQKCGEIIFDGYGTNLSAFGSLPIIFRNYGVNNDGRTKEEFGDNWYPSLSEFIEMLDKFNLYEVRLSGSTSGYITMVVQNIFKQNATDKLTAEKMQKGGYDDTMPYIFAV